MDLAWYHFIATYMIIVGAIIITIIPDKPLWLWGVIGLLIFSGLLMGVFLPHKEDKHANEEG
jgi:disulfide bond formation protein DsbB